MIKKGLFDTEPLWNLLNRHVKREDLISSGRSLLSGVHSMKKNIFEIIRESNRDILKGILASASIPGVFPAVKIGNDSFVDGGVSYSKNF
jgi:predicted acylesterase/phospholipase RssA